MKKLFNRKNLKFIIPISILLIILCSYIIIWLIYYNKTIKPLLDKSNGYNTQTIQGYTVKNDTFENDKLSGIVTLATPSFGKFSGNLSILQAIEPDSSQNISDPYTVDITISLKFKKSVLVTIYNSGSSTNSNLSISAEDIFEVDKDMNIIDKDKHTAESLELYEANRDVINELRAELVRRFGEDNLFD